MSKKSHNLSDLASQKLKCCSLPSTVYESSTSATDISGRSLHSWPGDMDYQLSLKQLRREHAVQLRQVKEEERRKGQLALKDLRSRLHQEKGREMEALREALIKKLEVESQALSTRKDLEIRRLQNDVEHLKKELQQSEALPTASQWRRGTYGIRRTTNLKQGFSISARDFFDEEQQKFQQEIRELLSAKRQLDGELTQAKERERKAHFQLKQVKEVHSAELQKLKKDADLEIRRLLEELKAKDRVLNNMNAEGIHKSPKLTSEKPSIQTCSNSSEDTNGFSEASKTIYEKYVNTTNSSLQLKIRRLEDENSAVSRRLSDTEQKLKSLLQKNKDFLHKNMELSTQNRALEDQLREAVDQTSILKSELQQLQTSPNLQPSQDLSTDILESPDITAMRNTNIELEKAVSALKLANAEKDRRIELILHRKKRRKSTSKLLTKNFGVKETFFGYEEAESVNGDRESLSSSMLSLDASMDEEDQVFDEIGMDGVEQNYAQLTKEHLLLEQAYATLKASTNRDGTLDSERDVKRCKDLEADLLSAQTKIEDLEKMLKSQGQTPSIIIQDTGWMEDKEKLNKTIRTMKEKLLNKERDFQKVKQELQEIQEHSEVMEFQKLELEEQCEKLSEQLNTSCSDSGIRLSPSILFSESPSSLDAQMSLPSPDVDFNAILETFDLVELCDKLSILAVSQRDSGAEDRVVVINQSILAIQSLKRQADYWQDECHAQRQLSEKYLEDLEGAKLPQTESHNTGQNSDSDNQRTSQTETLCSSVDHTELVLEYEALRNNFISSNQKVEELQKEAESSHKRETVLKFQVEHLNKLEQSYQDQIEILKRRLSDFTQNREFESAVLNDKVTQARKALMRAEQAEEEAKKLQEHLKKLGDAEVTKEDISVSSAVKTDEQHDKCMNSMEDKAMSQDILDSNRNIHGKPLDKAGSSAAEITQHLPCSTTVKALEQADVESSTTILKLLDTKAELNSKIKKLTSEVGQENVIGQLEDKSIATELTSAVITKMERDLKLLQQQLLETSDHLDWMKNEDLNSTSSERLEQLQEQVHKMTENEARLAETIHELEEVELQLRSQLSEQEEQRKTIALQSVQIQRLQESEENLKNRLEQMNTNETLLRSQLKQTGQSACLKCSRNSENPQGVPQINVDQSVQTSTQASCLKQQARLVTLLKHFTDSLVEMDFHSCDDVISSSGVNNPEAGDGCPTKESTSNQEDWCSSILFLLKSIYKNMQQVQFRMQTFFSTDTNILKEVQDLPEGIKTMKDLINYMEKLRGNEKVLLEKIEKQKLEIQTVLESKAKDLAVLKNELSGEMANCSKSQAELKEKIEVLESSEDKLMEQVSRLEEENEHLLTTIEKQEKFYNRQNSLINMKKNNNGDLVTNGIFNGENEQTSQPVIKKSKPRLKETLHASIDNSYVEPSQTLTEKKERFYLEEIKNLRSKLEGHVCVPDTAESKLQKRVKQLQEKVDLLALSEEKLMETAAENQEVADQLRQEVDNYEKSLTAARESNKQLEEALQQLQWAKTQDSSEKISVGLEKHLHQTEDETNDTKCTSDKKLNKKPTEKIMADLKSENQLLLQDIEAQKHTMKMLEKKLTLNSPLEESARIKQLRCQNAQLLETVTTITADLHLENFHHSTMSTSVLPEEGSPNHSHVSLKPTAHSLQETAPQESADVFRNYLCCCQGPDRPSITTLSKMSTQELVELVMNLQRLQVHQCLQFQRLVRAFQLMQQSLQLATTEIQSLTSEDQATQNHPKSLEFKENLRIVELEHTIQDLREQLKQQNEKLVNLMSQKDFYFIETGQTLLNSTEMVSEKQEMSSEEQINHLQQRMKNILHILKEQLKWESYRCEKVHEGQVIESCCQPFHNLNHSPNLELEKGRNEMPEKILKGRAFGSTTHDSNLQQQLDELYKLEAFQRKQIVELEGKCNELHEVRRQDQATIHDLSVEMERYKLQGNSLISQLNRSDGREEQLAADLDKLRYERDDLAFSIQELHAKEHEQARQLTKVQESLAQREAEVHALQETVARKKEQLNKNEAKGTTALDILQAKVDKLSDELDEKDGTMLNINRELRAQQDKNTALVEKLQSAQDSTDAALVQVNEAQWQAGQNEERAEQLSQQLGRVQEALLAVKQELQTAEIREKQLRARISVLEELLNEAQASDVGKDSKQRVRISPTKVQCFQDRAAHVQVLQAQVQQFEQEKEIKKEPFGHETELQELREMRLNYRRVQETLELLRENYDDTKLQLSFLQNRLQPSEEPPLWKAIETKQAAVNVPTQTRTPAPVQAANESFSISVHLDHEHSSMSSPPPLPVSTPPVNLGTDIFSADEASELDDDDHMKHYSKADPSVGQQERGKSAEPEMIHIRQESAETQIPPTRISRSEERLLNLPPPSNLAKTHQSTESIPDDSGFQDPGLELTSSPPRGSTDGEKMKVTHLERQLKAARLTSGTQSDLIQQLRDKVELLEKSGSRSKFILEELSGKEQEIRSLKLKCELLEKTRDQMFDREHAVGPSTFVAMPREHIPFIKKEKGTNTAAQVFSRDKNIARHDKSSQTLSSIGRSEAIQTDSDLQTCQKCKSAFHYTKNLDNKNELDEIEAWNVTTTSSDETSKAAKGTLEDSLLDPQHMASLKKRHSLDVSPVERGRHGQRLSYPTPLRSSISCAISPVRTVTLNSFPRPPVASAFSGHTLPRSKKQQRTPNQSGSPELSRPFQKEFRAVKKYDPYYFSTSGQKDGELYLEEGARVLQLGPVNDEGYFEAESSGKIGLVPIGYLRPCSPRRQLPLTPNMSFESLPGQPSSRSSTPGVKNRPVRPMTPTISHPAYARYTPSPALSVNSEDSQGINDNVSKPYMVPPQDLHIRATLGIDTALLAWRPPILEVLGQTNRDNKVIGYAIQVNQSTTHLRPGTNFCYCLIQGLLTPSILGVRTMAESGAMSAITSLSWKPGMSGQESISLAPAQISSFEEPVVPKLYMAVRDYSPRQNLDVGISPRLILKAGDIFKVYGSQRNDGYFTAKMGNQVGLVPVSAVEKIPIVQYTTKKKVASKSQKDVQQSDNYSLQSDTTENSSGERKYPLKPEVAFV